MKLIPAIALFTAAAAIAIGLYQQSQLHKLRAREKALTSGREALERSRAREGFDPAGDTAAGPGPASRTRTKELSSGFDRESWLVRLNEFAAGDRRDESDMVRLMEELSTAPKEDLLRLLRDVDTADIASRHPIMNTLLAVLTEVGPSAAVEFIVSRPETDPFSGNLTVAAAKWSIDDPGAALAWFQDREATGGFPGKSTSFKDRLHLSILTGAAVDDPAGLPLGPIAQVSDAGPVDAFVERVADSLKSSVDQIAFARRLASLDGEPGVRVMNALGKAWSRNFLFADAAALSDSLGVDAAWNPVRYWTAVNGHDAPMSERFDWFLGESRGVERQSRAVSLVSRWAQSDFNGTGAFLQSLPPSTDRDHAVDIFAKSIADLEPPSAVDWALDIADTAMQRRTLAQIYESWSRKDAPGAREYFAAKGVDPGQFASKPR